MRGEQHGLNSRQCQELVNSQVNVNRAVWCMNIEDKTRKHHADGFVESDYIQEQVAEAIASLQNVLNQKDLFSK